MSSKYELLLTVSLLLSSEFHLTWRGSRVQCEMTVRATGNVVG